MGVRLGVILPLSEVKGKALGRSAMAGSSALLRMTHTRLDRQKPTPARAKNL
jgi:hypothetical protein